MHGAVADSPTSNSGVAMQGHTDALELAWRSWSRGGAEQRHQDLSMPQHKSQVIRKLLMPVPQSNAPLPIYIGRPQKLILVIEAIESA